MIRNNKVFDSNALDNEEPTTSRKRKKKRAVAANVDELDDFNVDFVLVYQKKKKEKDVNEEDDLESMTQKQKHRTIFFKNLLRNGLRLKKREDGNNVFILINTSDFKEISEIVKLKVPLPNKVAKKNSFSFMT